MDLFEYQARDLFAKHGVPVLAGEVIDTPEAAREATEKLGGKSVVKAQVKVGGRGKAGGVKLAADADEAVARATDILGMDIKGHTVHKVMIAELSPEIEAEYVSYLLDRTNRTFLAMASVQGGMDIEEVGEKTPEALAKVPVDSNSGVDIVKAREIVAQAKFPADVAEGVAEAMVTLSEHLHRRGRLPGRGQPAGEDQRQPHPGAGRQGLARRERRLAPAGARGPRGQGRGPTRSRLPPRPRTSTTSSWTARFLDIGGGASAEVMANGLEIILGDPDVKSVFVNVFGGITACDEVANGIVQALALLEDKGEKVHKPLVVRLDGNNAELGGTVLLRRARPPAGSI
ncbi:succinate--CoA ligase [ADP-forming] subunit beta 1 [Streptomyces badius]